MEANRETIGQIVERCEGDPDVLEMLEEALASFESYHTAIYALELRRRLYARGGMEGEAFRASVSELDAARTIRHNAVIAYVGILNRLAARYGASPFYEGVVSEERPFRRQLADAVLAYTEGVVRDRA